MATSTWAAAWAGTPQFTASMTWLQDALRESGGIVFERFTDRARRVLVLAQEEARLLEQGHIGTEHLLLGLIHEGEGVAYKALETFSINLDNVRAKVKERIGVVEGESRPTGSPPFTPRAKKVLELGLREALQLGHNYIGTEHMLLGLVREGQGVAAQVLIDDLGLDLSKIRQAVIQLLSGYAAKQRPEPPERRSVNQPFTSNEIEALAQYGGLETHQVILIAWITQLKLTDPENVSVPKAPDA